MKTKCYIRRWGSGVRGFNEDTPQIFKVEGEIKGGVQMRLLKPDGSETTLVYPFSHPLNETLYECASFEQALDRWRVTENWRKKHAALTKQLRALETTVNVVLRGTKQ
jgi:hypothetical protein